MLGQVRVGVADGRQQLVLGLRVEVDQRDRRRLLGRLLGEQRVDQLGGALARRRQVVRPPQAALGHVDSAQEARDDLAQLMEHQLAVLACFGQRVGLQPQEQRLEALPAAVDADVGQRPSRKDPPGGVEGFGTCGLPEHEIAVGRVLLDRGSDVIGDRAQHVAVRIEHAVHVADVPRAQPAGEHRRVAVVAIAPAEAGVVGDVAGALLEVAHQATPLEHLRQHVRGLLAGDVHAGQLGHGIVAVLDEHLLVQVFGPLEADRGVDRVITRDVEIADELVEEEPPEALGAAAVPGEQRALHDLGKVDQREDRPVQVREVPPEHVPFFRCELLGDVGSHRRRT